MSHMRRPWTSSCTGWLVRCLKTQAPQSWRLIRQLVGVIERDDVELIKEAQTKEREHVIQIERASRQSTRPNTDIFMSLLWSKRRRDPRGRRPLLLQSSQQPSPRTQQSNTYQKGLPFGGGSHLECGVHICLLSGGLAANGRRERFKP